jgi:tripartite-type tricarboxylate transporter receptor subunit TctC
VVDETSSIPFQPQRKLPSSIQSRRALMGAVCLTACLGVGLSLSPIASGVTPALAQTASDFYRDKTLKIVVAAAPGAAYDFVARTLAASIGRHIPGNPRVIVENMYGAGGIVLMNMLYNKAARDGTVMGLTLNGIVLEPRLKLLSHQTAAVNFDLTKMSFVGSPAQQPQILWVWHGSPFKTVDDLKGTQVIMGSTSVGADNYVLPTLTNAYLGTKLHVVRGYTAINDLFIAAERGELHGATVTYASLAGKSDWVRDKKARVLLQYGVERLSEESGVPTAAELAIDEKGRRALHTYALKFKATYPFILPPGVPQERVALLRSAFMDTMKDPQFIQDGVRLGFDVDPVPGDAIGKIIEEIDAAPQDVIDDLKSRIMN